MEVHRFDIYLLDSGTDEQPVSGFQRPWIVISPEEINRHLRTLIVAPLIAESHDYPTRISIRLNGDRYQIVLDQLHTIERDRIGERVGTIDKSVRSAVSRTLREMFSV